MGNTRIKQSGVSQPMQDTSQSSRLPVYYTRVNQVSTGLDYRVIDAAMRFVSLQQTLVSITLLSFVNLYDFGGVTRCSIVFIWGGVFVQEFSSARLTAEDLIITLPLMKPRHYSISSASEVQPRHMKLTVGVLKAVSYTHLTLPTIYSV